MRQEEDFYDPELGLSLAYVRSHEKHMRYIYGLRFGGLAPAAIIIAIGAPIMFRGMAGSFNWVVEVSHTTAAKFTNASPSIVLPRLVYY
jgi:hypothetical protein